MGCVRSYQSTANALTSQTGVNAGDEMTTAKSQMSKCPHCGQQFPGDTAVCALCHVCAKCSTVMSDPSQPCPSCGLDNQINMGAHPHVPLLPAPGKQDFTAQLTTVLEMLESKKPMPYMMIPNTLEDWQALQVHGVREAVIIRLPNDPEPIYPKDGKFKANLVDLSALPVAQWTEKEWDALFGAVKGKKSAVLVNDTVLPSVIKIGRLVLEDRVRMSKAISRVIDETGAEIPLETYASITEYLSKKVDPPKSGYNWAGSGSSWGSLEDDRSYYRQTGVYGDKQPPAQRPASQPPPPQQPSLFEKQTPRTPSAGGNDSAKSTATPKPGLQQGDINQLIILVQAANRKSAWFGNNNRKVARGYLLRATERDLQIVKQNVGKKVTIDPQKGLREELARILGIDLDAK